MNFTCSSRSNAEIMHRSIDHSNELKFERNHKIIISSAAVQRGEMNLSAHLQFIWRSKFRFEWELLRRMNNIHCNIWKNDWWYGMFFLVTFALDARWTHTSRVRNWNGPSNEQNREWLLFNHERHHSFLPPLWAMVCASVYLFQIRTPHLPERIPLERHEHDECQWINYSNSPIRTDPIGSRWRLS